MVSRQQPWHTNSLWAKNARFCSEHINDGENISKNEDLNHLWTFLNWNCEMPNFVQNKPHWHHITSMIWSSVKKNSFLWRNGSKVKIWGAICLWINVNVLMNWKCEKASIAHSFDSDDCPYDRLVISKIKKTFICKMSKRPCSQYPNLTTTCPQTSNDKSWKEVWLLWTIFGPFHVLCATPGLGSQAPPECVSCKNSINEEWLLQLRLVQCLSAGPTAQPRSALLAPRAWWRLATVLTPRRCRRRSLSGWQGVKRRRLLLSLLFLVWGNVPCFGIITVGIIY